MYNNLFLNLRMRASFFGRHLPTAMIVVAAAAASPASASETSGPHNYSAIQFQIDDLDNDRVNEDGYGWRILHGIPLDDRWALEISGSGHRMERPSGEDGNDRFFTFGADGIFNLNGKSYTQNSISPFVGGGLGLFHDDTNNQPDNAFYANLTAGVLVPLLGDLARLRLDARYALVVSDSSPATVNPTGNGDTRFAEIIYGVGIQYALGQQRRKDFSCSSCDSDNDGIRNPVDYCPQSVQFSSVDNRGCAIPAQPQASAVFSPLPAAVNNEPASSPIVAKETPTKVELVPAPAVASVPAPPPAPTPEVKVVSAPVVVPAVADPDQYVPETVAEFDAPEYVVAKTELPVAAAPIRAAKSAPKIDSLAISQIKFENGSARLLPTSAGVLDQVIEAMNSQPNVNYEIQGHTDSQGSDAANLRLSQLRAHSVRNYLIEGGVSGWRLTAIGYGESAPIADNETPNGREKNRRVAFEPTR